MVVLPEIFPPRVHNELLETDDTELSLCVLNSDRSESTELTAVVEGGMPTTKTASHSLEEEGKKSENYNVRIRSNGNKRNRCSTVFYPELSVMLCKDGQQNNT